MRLLLLLRVIKRIGGKWLEAGKPMNKQVDGDKFICLDKIVKSNNQCLIYSFGISNDWTFEDKMDTFGRAYLPPLKPEYKIMILSIRL